MPLDPSIPHADLTYRIIGCAMRVQSRLGPGLREKHYQRALTAEMMKEGLGVSEEHPVKVYDGDVWLGNLYLDHLVENCVVVEDKAFSHMLTEEEDWQVLTYLGATKLKVGLLFNFGRNRLQYERKLAPKDVQEWQEHLHRYIWRPRDMGPLPCLENAKLVCV
jgi:GxxExxY protein